MNRTLYIGFFFPFVVLWLTVTTPVCAQHRLDSSKLVGLTGQFGLESITMSGPSVGGDSTLLPFSSYGDITGSGSLFSLGAFVSIPVLFDGRFRVGTRLQWSRRERTLQFGLPGYVVRPLSEQVWYASASDELKFQSDALQFELTGQWRIKDHLILRAGPLFGYRFTPAVTFSNDGVLTPSETRINNDRVAYHFTSEGTEAIISGVNGDKAIRIPEDELIFTSSETDAQLEYGGVIGLSVGLPLSKHYLIVPDISIQGFTAPVFSELGGTGFSARLGLSFSRRFPITQDVPSDDTASTSIRDPLTPDLNPISEPEVPVRIAVRSLDSDGRELSHVNVYVYETLTWNQENEQWDVAREIEQPVLQLEPSYPADVERWEIAFIYKNITIAKGTSDDDNPLSTVDWSIAPETDSLHPLVVEFVVTDSSGTVVKVHDQIPVQYNYVVRIVDQQEDRSTFTLYPFAQGVDEVSERNMLVLKEVLSTVEDGSRITVTGFVEEEGTVSSVELSGQRTRQVLQQLRRLCAKHGYSGLSLNASPYQLHPGMYRKSLPSDVVLSPHVEIHVARD